MRRGGAGKKRDANEEAIVAALERVGCSVYRLTGVGVADLLVRTRWRGLWLMEVKSESGALTPDQAEFRLKFPETVTVRSVEDALRIVGVHADRKAHDANT